jgi:hypothetical protein
VIRVMPVISTGCLASGVCGTHDTNRSFGWICRGFSGNIHGTTWLPAFGAAAPIPSPDMSEHHRPPTFDSCRASHGPPAPPVLTGGNARRSVIAARALHRGKSSSIATMIHASGARHVHFASRRTGLRCIHRADCRRGATNNTFPPQSVDLERAGTDGLDSTCGAERSCCGSDRLRR